MKIYVYIALLFFSLSLCGCYSYQGVSQQTVSQPSVSEQESQKQQAEEIKKAMDSWIGTHKSKLIQQVGPPTRYASDGQGGEILIYETSRSIGMTAYGTYMQRTLIDYREVFANSNGIIYHWRTGTR
ncbi:MAG: hypothetical protein JXB49_29640 [Bacteroidales bacterium]|nr:hypothetical protein [Bacteroidales bacterium]